MKKNTKKKLCRTRLLKLVALYSFFSSIMKEISLNLTNGNADPKSRGSIVGKEVAGFVVFSQ